MCADAPDVPPVEPPEGVECLESLFRGTPAGICVLDTELRYLYVNPALEEMHGIPAAEHLGRTVEDILPELNVSTDLLRGALADGRAREVASSGRTPSSDHPGLRFWQGACHRVEQDGEVRGLVLIMLEVLAPRRRHAEYERVSRHLTMLDTATNRIGTTLDMNTTCRELAEFVVPELADVASVEVSVPEIGHPVRPPPAGVARLRRAGMAAVPGLAEAVRQFGEPGQYADYQDGGAIPVCLETNQPVVQNLSTDAQLTASAPSPERVAVYRALGFHSVCIVPLTSRGRPLGCLALVRAGDSPAFTDQDVAVARELAVRAAVDLDHARRYTREHGIALELQRALLSEPREPHPHIEVATRYLPVGQGAEVGGDWFDVVPLSDARHLKVMGDVMGHGVEAAVAMSHYRSMVRLLAQDELPPHVILERLDLMVEKAGIDRAATCLLAVVDRFRGVPGGQRRSSAAGVHRPRSGRRDRRDTGRAAARHGARRLPDRLAALRPGNRAVHVHRRPGGTQGRGHRCVRQPAGRPAAAGRRDPGGPARRGARPVRPGRHGRHRGPRVPDPLGADPGSV